MARDIAISKLAKISEAQKYMIAAVFGASVVLGISVCLVIHSINQISYNANVIIEEDQSIVAYSNAISSIGVCTKPKGSVYTDDEIKKCNPDSVQTSSVPNTLRSKILVDIASNEALASVPNVASSECINKNTGKAYTYDELQAINDAADTDAKIVEASELIQLCSALRVIPDALPSYLNEEALLASLNKIFRDSNWEPDSLSPTGEISDAGFGTNLNAVSIRLAVEANTATTMTVLSNVERSIREFNINNATIEWGSNDTLILTARATAYYMSPSILNEATKTVKGGK